MVFVFAFYKKWWFRLDLNQRHNALQASALPTELQNHSQNYNTKIFFTTPLSSKKLRDDTEKHGIIVFMRKLNTSPISGMQEFLPADQAIFDNFKDKISEVYHSHGFQHIETPTIDRSEILFAKAGGDTEKQIYKVFKTAETADTADQALRFDHTVPLARYVVEHENDLSFPFRVTQIGRNFRGERAQKGRFREFYQCDLDVIGRGNLPIAYDAEVIATYFSTLEALNLPKPIVRISNRKILTGLIEELALEQFSGEIFGIIDHAEKVPAATTRESLDNLKIGADAVEKIIDFIDIHGTKREVEKRLRNFDFGSETFLAGVEELLFVLDLLEKQGLTGKTIADMLIVRGLDYYTGTVFEAVLDDYRYIGSIGGGGRYENLTGHFSDQSFPGVGGSIGLSRLFFVLQENKLLTSVTRPPIDFAIVPISEHEFEFCFELADKIRKRGQSVDIIFSGKKLGDKLTHAGKIAQFAVVVGENETKSGNLVKKNLVTGEQSKLDA